MAFFLFIFFGVFFYFCFLFFFIFMHIAKLNGRICGAKRPHSDPKRPTNLVMAEYSLFCLITHKYSPKPCQWCIYAGFSPCHWLRLRIVLFDRWKSFFGRQKTEWRPLDAVNCTSLLFFIFHTNLPFPHTILTIPPSWEGELKVWDEKENGSMRWKE